MADNSDSRELENNSWVIASSETVPVEDLGPKAAETENEQGKEGPQAPLGDCNLSNKQPESEEPKPKDPEGVLPPTSGATSSPGPAKTLEPIHLEKECSSPRTEEAADNQDSGPRSLPATQVPLLVHKTGPLGEPMNTSSGEEDGSGDRDVEGLRRRKGRETHSAGPNSPRDRQGEPVGGEDGILPGTTWLLGLLAIFGVGILAFSGVVFEVDEGPVDMMSAWSGSDGKEPHSSGKGKDWPAEVSPESTSDGGHHQAKEVPPSVAPTQSLENMGHLLDKLAKENQEIRRMQAELQAQKEELQSLLRKTEGEALEFTTQQQNLATENTQLLEALSRETSALRAARAEILLLQEKLQSPGETGDVKPRQPQEEQHHGKAERPEAEIRRLRSLLASVRQDLAKASQHAPLGEGAKGLQKMLGDVQQKLSQELEHGEGERGVRREGHKAKRGKDKVWHKRHERPEEPRSWHHEDRKEHRFKAPGDGPQHSKKHGPRDAKPAKDLGHHQVARKSKKPTEPHGLWEMLSQHRYRAPQGCAGVTDCAQQEGLLPVQKTVFLPLVQSYLTRLGWAEHYGGLAAALDHVFDHGGVFAHDRQSLADVLDEIEDALEDLAQMLGGSEEQVDDFEAVILQQLGAAPGGRFTQRSGAQRNPKERNRDAPHGPKNSREGASRTHG